MILLLTGQPGSGKTLRTMWYLKNDSQFQGRSIFSNIEGSAFQPIPNGDWTQVPDGSVVVIDEVQFWYPQRKPGLKIPDQVSAMDTHRHRGIDFILTTQRPTGVDHHVRGLVGRHEHMKSMTKHSATVWSRNEAWDSTDGKERKAPGTESFLWKYPKELFGSYKSAVLHTQKIKIPKKVWFALVALLVAVLGGAMAVAQVRSMINETPGQERVEQMEQYTASSSQNLSEGFQTQLPTRDQPQSENARKSLSGCVYRHRDDSCRCYDNNGGRYDYTYGQCIEHAQGW